VNNLKRSLKAGEEVIVNKDHFQGVDPAEKERIFICESGFGMQSFATGTRIFGRWKMDNSPGVVRGQNIDTEATIRHQSKTRLTDGCRK
jgi:hypothetical protein